MCPNVDAGNVLESTVSMNQGGWREESGKRVLCTQTLALGFLVYICDVMTWLRPHVTGNGVEPRDGWCH